MNRWDNFTSRWIGNRIDGIAVGEVRHRCAARRTDRHAARIAPNQIRLQLCFLWNDIAGSPVFQRPLLFDAINLAEVVDARFVLARFRRLHEVSDRYGRQNPDDGHHDHDFHQREASLPDQYKYHNTLIYL